MGRDRKSDEESFTENLVSKKKKNEADISSVSSLTSAHVSLPHQYVTTETFHFFHLSIDDHHHHHRRLANMSLTLKLGFLKLLYN